MCIRDRGNISFLEKTGKCISGLSLHMSDFINICGWLQLCLLYTSHVDDNGCILTAGKMKGYLEHPRILGLGEVMDAPSVINIVASLTLWPSRPIK